MTATVSGLGSTRTVMDTGRVRHVYREVSAGGAAVRAGPGLPAGPSYWTQEPWRTERTYGGRLLRVHPEQRPRLGRVARILGSMRGEALLVVHPAEGMLIVAEALPARGGAYDLETHDGTVRASASGGEVVSHFGAARERRRSHVGP